MSYRVPSLEELVKYGMERHRAELPGTDAFLWPNTEHVFLKAVGGLVHLNYQYLEWIKRQRFATEADGDELDNHGKPFGLTRNAATKAYGNVAVTGTPGTTLAVGTMLSRSDGARFLLTAQAVIQQDGTTTASIEAETAGADGNTPAYAEFALTSFTSGVTSVTADAIGIGGGAELEDDESFRTRILFRMRNPPRGGAAHDYVYWALMIPGVTRVWVESTAYGPGTVGVWFMTDGIGNGIPNQTTLGAVKTYIESQKPVTARPIVQVPIAAQIDVCMSGMPFPSADLHAAIRAEIADVFRRQVDVSLPSKRFTLRTNLFWQAVARVTGSAEHKISRPSADIEMLPGYIPVMGDVCYV